MHQSLHKNLSSDYLNSSCLYRQTYRHNNEILICFSGQPVICKGTTYSYTSVDYLLRTKLVKQCCSSKKRDSCQALYITSHLHQPETLTCRILATESLAVPVQLLKFFSEQQMCRWLGVVNPTADVTFKALKL